ncbi:hypothetical protein PILCRDRAFT_220667 [Piloderma croceum F 1598]|uniref:Uncharacterized protein n=1 Tax=Piloderma croceum (strain F 1598) TaxID=765440 RepID=A0A0C3FYP7_PILCF|nr:hypothetical protein PILCRDRAFT_220667 [Piloderma croceum F 1598]
MQPTRKMAAYKSPYSSQCPPLNLDLKPSPNRYLRMKKQRQYRMWWLVLCTYRIARVPRYRVHTSMSGVIKRAAEAFGLWSSPRYLLQHPSARTQMSNCIVFLHCTEEPVIFPSARTSSDSQCTHTSHTPSPTHTNAHAFVLPFTRTTPLHHNDSARVWMFGSTLHHLIVMYFV